jgi:(E)-4-hydroxy-3-methylbut-2-enyl-diphosphate synthase
MIEDNSTTTSVIAERRRSRPVQLGDVTVGGGAPVSIQSMCSTDTRDVASTLSQIGSLHEAGCQIARVAVPDLEAAAALEAICEGSALPVVADIHFDYRLAIDAATRGIAGLRYNPGNIGSTERVEQLACAADDAGIPIRVGVNAGSLERDLRRSHGGATAEALVQSALAHAGLLEQVGFSRIKLSLKASDVLTTVAAYRLCAERCDYPLHLGVTEAGTLISGAVKSSAALAVLLAEGIGDTLRVSLSADPVEEIWVARQLLQGLGLAPAPGLELVSCPRCGRASVEVYEMAARIERRLRHVTTRLQVAVMGCEVNGPGEARAADVGIAGAAGGWVLFRAGEKVRRLVAEEAEEALITAALEVAARKQTAEAEAIGNEVSPHQEESETS